MNLMFTYGTLKQGYGNHRLIDGAEFIGRALTADKDYVMRANSYPIVWQAPLAKYPGRVSGEIYRVSEKQIAACDRLEGHPTMYRREQRQFLLEIGGGHDPAETVEAWVYIYQNPFQSEGDPALLVDGIYIWMPR